MEKNELVSICILCYNHEKFIAKVLDGILEQEISFDIKIYINDDCSIDNSLKIIEEYQKKEISKIELFRNDKNKGQKEGVINLLNQARGKYIVLMDGDDYWIYNKKLQTQIDFLEKNLDYIAYCHDAHIEKHGLDENPISSLQSKGFYKSISQFTKYSSNQIQPYELLKGDSYIQNSTLVWRKIDLTPILKLIKDVRYNLDWYLGVLLASKGKIHYENELWSVYSDHSGGRTKNNYFHSYLPDKVKLLKTLFKIDFYNKLYFRYILYELISKEYYGMIVMTSGSKKSKIYLFKTGLKYAYFSFLKTSSFLRYLLRYRNEFY